MRTLHVIDANCSWTRALAQGMPEDWKIRMYRIYSPQWLPNGVRDLLKSFRLIKKSDRVSEVLVVVPGWNKCPRISARLLQAVLLPSLGKKSDSSAALFTFPFYSAVARWLKAKFPRVPVAYHAHDPFEFYGYPVGYARGHEDLMVPVCDKVFTISEKLREDFRDRYPLAIVEVLRNAADESFVQMAEKQDMPADLRSIRMVGAPIVGCVGQINTSYDWAMLEVAASTNPQTQFVFLGNLFEEGDATRRIRQFFQRDNVHWLGPKPHHELKLYMENCDILLNPLIVNAHNDRRDALRLYDYLTTQVPIISTAIHGAKHHRALISIMKSSEEMTAALGQVPPKLSQLDLARRQYHLEENTWSYRARELANMLGERPDYRASQ